MLLPFSRPFATFSFWIAFCYFKLASFTFRVLAFCYFKTQSHYKKSVSACSANKNKIVNKNRRYFSFIFFFFYFYVLVLPKPHHLKVIFMVCLAAWTYIWFGHRNCLTLTFESCSCFTFKYICYHHPLISVWLHFYRRNYWLHLLHHLLLLLCLYLRAPACTLRSTLSLIRPSKPVSLLNIRRKSPHPLLCLSPTLKKLSKHPFFVPIPLLPTMKHLLFLCLTLVRVRAPLIVMLRGGVRARWISWNMRAFTEMLSSYFLLAKQLKGITWR